MSTKNIALDSKVYAKLAQLKQESESFSKAINRIIKQAKETNTGRDILSRLSEVSALGEDEAKSMLKLIDENRTDEDWRDYDLR
jgi:predicted CopG family antitoxin